MEILILPMIGILLYYFVFNEDKSELTKLKEALKNTDSEDLKFVKELIANELEKRDKQKQ